MRLFNFSAFEIKCFVINKYHVYPLGARQHDATKKTERIPSHSDEVNTFIQALLIQYLYLRISEGFTLNIRPLQLDDFKQSTAPW